MSLYSRRLAASHEPRKPCGCWAGAPCDHETREPCGCPDWATPCIHDSLPKPLTTHSAAYYLNAGIQRVTEAQDGPRVPLAAALDDLWAALDRLRELQDHPDMTLRLRQQLVGKGLRRDRE